MKTPSTAVRQEPLPAQVAERIRDLIVRDRLVPDYRLPYERELGEQFGVSPNRHL